MADMYGEQIADAAHDAIVTLMNTLVTSMSSDDPRPSYVYERHDVAGVQLNALSVGLDGSAINPTGVAGGPWPTLDLHFSIRVHTAYGSDPVDDRKTSRLCQSVFNKMYANLWSLGDGYHVADVSMTIGETFDASYTGGGVVEVRVEFETYYEQD